MMVMMVMTNLLIRDFAGLGSPSMLWMLAMLARLFSLHNKKSLILKMLFMLVKLFSLKSEQRLKDTSLQKKSSLPSGEWGVKDMREGKPALFKHVLGGKNCKVIKVTNIAVQKH